MAGQMSVTEQRKRLRTKRGPGKGLLDWIKLCRSFSAGQQTNPDQLITCEELRKHNTQDDCWTAFRGEVTRKHDIHDRIIMPYRRCQGDPSRKGRTIINALLATV